MCATDHKFLYRDIGAAEPVISAAGPRASARSANGYVSSRSVVVVMSELLQRAAHAGASSRTRRLALGRHSLVLGCGFGNPSAVARVESAVIARFRIAISLLGQPDHAWGVGWEAAARHCPQVRQIVVPPAGSAAGHRMDGTLARPSCDQATCSVSCAQPEQ